MLLPDGGRGYLARSSTTSGWPTTASSTSTAGETVGERAARASPARRPTLVHTHPNETVREAIDILREYGVTQMPVVRAEPPVTAGEVVGSVDEKALLDALFAGHGQPRRPRSSSTCRRRCRSSAPASRSAPRWRALGAADALLVHVDGKPAGVLTRQDVLGHLAGADAYGRAS